MALTKKKMINANFKNIMLPKIGKKGENNVIESNELSEVNESGKPTFRSKLNL